MNTFSIYVAGFAALAMVQCQPAAKNVAQGPELERLIQNVIADDAKVAVGAQEQLKKMGPEVVPVLFDRLVTSGWDLKPPLLEVLTYHGLDWAKKKLLEGTDAEKTHAALLFELIDDSEHQDTAEFKAMVEVLLKALESDDKYLRAAAGHALVHDEESTIFFQHLHRIVPALISSFDTDLVVRRRHREDVSEWVFIGISLRLDLLIGDRLAFAEIKPTIWENVAPPRSDSHPDRRCAVRSLLARSPAELESLRAYWEKWWESHSSMTAIEIGKLTIERSIRLLEADKRRRSSDPPSKRTRAHAESVHWSMSSLGLWTRGLRGPIVGDDRAASWGAWWEEHMDTYEGPRILEE